MYNVEVDNAEDLDIAIPMYNLLGYSENYAKRQLVYGNILEMSQIMIIQQILNHLNLNQALQVILMILVFQT